MIPSTAESMDHWKITIAYDGTEFHGWQVQPGLSTIQGTLSTAIQAIMGERVLPQGSGRTDAGVHALGQVASFTLQSAIPAANLQRALNHHLPPSVRVLKAEGVSATFHARHSARRKTYEYRIFPRRPICLEHTRTGELARENRICPPFLAPYVWDTGLPLNFPSLERAAAHIIGTHDFTSFAATEPESPPCTPTALLADHPPTPATKCRTIWQSSWQFTGELLIYRVTGSGFLYNMVRNLVGTFVEAGTGRIDPDKLPDILAARQRSAAGPTAAARGLFLAEVEY